MDIFEDKDIIKLIDELKSKSRKENISTKKTKNLSAPRFVFVCGKEIIEEEETIRKHTINALEEYKISSCYGSEHENVLCVISEYLYIQDLAEDIFSFENMLAELSDKIIIVAESPGTFCELGAFVMDEECRKKTIVINEDKDEYKNSFITKGPIKKLAAKNEKNIILHNGLGTIKDNHQYRKKIKEVANSNLKIHINTNSDKIELKSMIYELANIIEMFQPIESFEIETLYKQIKEFSSYTIKNKADHKIRTIRQVLNLMEKMKIINKEDGYYKINHNISCYNVLFKITRKEFNDFRINYLNRLNKCQRYRMERL